MRKDYDVPTCRNCSSTFETNPELRKHTDVTDCQFENCILVCHKCDIYAGETLRGFKTHLSRSHKNEKNESLGGYLDELSGVCSKVNSCDFVELEGGFVQNLSEFTPIPGMKSEYKVWP